MSDQTDIAEKMNAGARLRDAAPEMYAALKAYELLDQKHANCEECETELQPELCPKCFPFADDARLKMRAAIAGAESDSASTPVTCTPKPITFTPPAIDAAGKMVRSNYSADGGYAPDLPTTKTVGELIEVLRQLPPSLLLLKDFCYVQPTWFNVGTKNEHLSVEESDEEYQYVDDYDDE